MTEAVNPLIADAFALYVKTKNFHWHLSGSHFRDYHLLFDEQAEAILASIDIMAERVRRIGGTTIRSISHIGQLQTIVDDNNDFVPSSEMVKRLMKDNGQMAKMLRNAIEVCDKQRDSAISNALQEILDETERRKWFLFEVMHGLPLVVSEEGIFMIQESFLVHPRVPFRLDLTVWALRRRASNSIDQWDGATYTRIFVVDGVPVKASVSTRLRRSSDGKMSREDSLR